MDAKHEINLTPQLNKCFLSSQAKGEIFLYDEAEPLLYNCSEKSFPVTFVKSKQNYYGLTAAESDWEALISKSGSESDTFHKYSGYDFLMNLRKEPVQSQFVSPVPPTSASGFTVAYPEVNTSGNRITTFERAIIQKFREIYNSSQDKQPYSTPQKVYPEKQVDEEAGLNLKQLYLCKSQFVVSCSTNSCSEALERPNPMAEEVFSNSDSGEAIKRSTRKNSYDKDSQLTLGAKDRLSNEYMIEGITLHHQSTREPFLSPHQMQTSDSKPRENVARARFSSIANGGGFMTPRPNRQEKKRNDRPVSPTRHIQKKPPMKALATAQTPRTFVQEIKKSNMVMKEDIYSSSKPEGFDDSPLINLIKEENNRKRADPNKILLSKEVQPEVLTRNLKPRPVSPGNCILMEGDVIYETLSDKRLCKIITTKRTPLIEKQKTQGFSRSNCWNDQGMERGYNGKHFLKKRQVLGGHTKDDVKKCENKDEQAFNPQLNLSSHLNVQNARTGHSASEVMAKYVKLPGFPEAFGTKDCNIADLRIKNGISFESLNALEVIQTGKMLGVQGKVEKYRNNPYECLSETTMRRNLDESVGQSIHPNNEQLKNAATNCQSTDLDTIWNKQMETRDASAGPRIVNEDKITQTEQLDNRFLSAILTTDMSIQCDSRILNPKDDGIHKEIMICDDDGNRVQLYNSLGFPLTDMDGYLLKDSLGRFMVKFDQLGVPICCNNEGVISLEDGASWSSAKGRLNVIHQSSKKNIFNKPVERRSKSRFLGKPSISRIGSAMRNLSHSLDSADTFLSLDTKTLYPSTGRVYHEAWENLDHVRGNSSQQRNNDRKVSSLNNDEVGNSSTLVAEIQSIAKLRNALLEKVNIMAQRRKTPVMAPGNVTKSLDHSEAYRTRRSNGDSQWSIEPRVLKNSTYPLGEHKHGQKSSNTTSSENWNLEAHAWTKPIKLTPAGKFFGKENTDVLDVTQQGDKRSRKVGGVSKFFEIRHSPPRELTTRRDRFFQMDDILEDRRGSYLKKMEKNMLMKWDTSNPTEKAVKKISVMG